MRRWNDSPGRDPRFASGSGTETVHHSSSLDRSGAPSEDWGLGCAAEVESCLHRICGWRVPPNWSAPDWFEEIRAVAVESAWEAEREFDGSRGVSLAAFVHSRTLGRALARYRQEWSFGLRFSCRQVEDEGLEATDESSSTAQPFLQLAGAPSHELWEAVNLLDSAQRRLVIQLFSEGQTEAEIAQELGLSQRAVSKRKQAALGVLRQCLQATP
jgi:RNA polymerase sigma factor (sigma-70 family)